MLAEALGTVGLSPAAFWAMSWEEYELARDCYDLRQQQQLAGARLVAAQVYNALADKPLTPAAYLPLPLVDGATPTARSTKPRETNQELFARLQREGLL